MRIIVKRLARQKYEAWISDMDNIKRGTGRSASEALGELMFHNSKVFGIFLNNDAFRLVVERK